MMKTFAKGVSTTRATVLRSAKPMSAMRPGGKTSADVKPAKRSGTIACTGGSAEELGEGAFAVLEADAEELPLGLRVDSRDVLAL